MKETDWEPLAQEVAGSKLLASGLGWDGRHLIALRTEGLDGGDQALANVFEAYDPATRSWSDMPKLSTEFPLVTSRFIVTKAGIAIAGRACDPATVKLDDMGVLDSCAPESTAVSLLAPDAEAFTSVPPPGSEADGVLSLQGTRSTRLPYAVRGTDVYRLARDLETWEEFPALPEEAGNKCASGESFFAVVGGFEVVNGKVEPARVLQLEKSGWAKLDLPVSGNHVSLSCSDASAVVRVSDEEQGVNETFLIPAEGAPSQVDLGDMESMSNSVVQWDGAHWVAQAPISGKDPSTGITATYLLDESSLAWQRSQVRPAYDVTVMALDGVTALYAFQDRSETTGSIETTYEVGPVAHRVGS